MKDSDFSGWKKSVKEKDSGEPEPEIKPLDEDDIILLKSYGSGPYTKQ